MDFEFKISSLNTCIHSVLGLFQVFINDLNADQCRSMITPEISNRKQQRHLWAVFKWILAPLKTFLNVLSAGLLFQLQTSSCSVSDIELHPPTLWVKWGQKRIKRVDVSAAQISLCAECLCSSLHWLVIDPPTQQSVNSRICFQDSYRISDYLLQHYGFSPVKKRMKEFRSALPRYPSVQPAQCSSLNISHQTPDSGKRFHNWISFQDGQ